MICSKLDFLPSRLLSYPEQSLFYIKLSLSNLSVHETNERKGNSGTGIAACGPRERSPHARCLFHEYQFLRDGVAAGLQSVEIHSAGQVRAAKGRRVLSDLLFAVVQRCHFLAKEVINLQRDMP